MGWDIFSRWVSGEVGWDRAIVVWGHRIPWGQEPRRLTWVLGQPATSTRALGWVHRGAGRAPGAGFAEEQECPCQSGKGIPGCAHLLPANHCCKKTGFALPTSWEQQLDGDFLKPIKPWNTVHFFFCAPKHHELFFIINIFFPP